jgi:hypothetical protein
VICKIVEVHYHEVTHDVIESMHETDAHKLVDELNQTLGERAPFKYRVEYVDRRKTHRGAC